MKTQITLDSLIKDLVERRMAGVTSKNVQRHLEGMTNKKEFISKVIRIVELQYKEVSVKDVSQTKSTHKIYS